MKEKELLLLKQNLFESGLIEKLHPGEIRTLKEDELSPFCDYYGALLGAEKFLKSKEQYRQLFPDVLEKDFSVVISRLLDNLFVPNYRTLHGKLNDRIRKTLLGWKPFPGSGTLDELVQGLSPGRRKVSQLHRMGFSFSEKARMEEEFEQHINNMLGYSEAAQALIFAVRPQIVDQSLNLTEVLHALFQKHYQLLGVLRKGNGRIIDGGIDESVSQLTKASPVIVGEPISEAEFFYKGRQYHSTKAFVKEWDNITCQIRKIEKIKENPVKGAFRFGLPSLRMPRIRLPRFRIPKKAIAIGVSSLAGAAVVFYALPSLRYDLWLPVSDMEKVEVLYDRQEYREALSHLNDIAETESKAVAGYWGGKINLASIVDPMNRLNSLKKRYEFAAAVLRNNIAAQMERGIPEIAPEDIIEELFDAGYIKRKNNMACVKDYSTQKSTAQSHLCSLFEQPAELMEPEERKLLDRIKHNDIFYVGSQGPVVGFMSLTPEGTLKIEYRVTKKGNVYEVAGITVE